MYEKEVKEREYRRDSDSNDKNWKEEYTEEIAKDKNYKRKAYWSLQYES